MLLLVPICVLWFKWQSDQNCSLFFCLRDLNVTKMSKLYYFLGWKSKSLLIVSLFDLWAHITQIYYIPSVYPHQSWVWTFCFNWNLKMRQKQLLFQAEKINLFQSKWSGLKKMVILSENSCHFVNLFSFQLKRFM